MGLLCPPSSIGKAVGYSLGQVIVCSDLSFDRTICKFDLNVIIPFYVCTFHLIIKTRSERSINLPSYRVINCYIVMCSL